MWQFAASFLYIGKLPFASGTWGSLGALILWIFLPLSYPLQLIIISILFIIGVISSQKFSQEIDDPDPSEVVIDEEENNEVNSTDDTNTTIEKETKIPSIGIVTMIITIAIVSSAKRRN